jgi:hypothetical protein
MTAIKTTQSRGVFVRKLERVLAQCMEHKYHHIIPVSTIIIQAKVKNLFGELNATDPDPKVTFYMTPWIAQS